MNAKRERSYTRNMPCFKCREMNSRQHTCREPAWEGGARLLSEITLGRSRPFDSGRLVPPWHVTSVDVPSYTRRDCLVRYDEMGLHLALWRRLRLTWRTAKSVAKRGPPSTSSDGRRFVATHAQSKLPAIMSVLDGANAVLGAPLPRTSKCAGDWHSGVRFRSHFRATKPAVPLGQFCFKLLQRRQIPGLCGIGKK